MSAEESWIDVSIAQDGGILKKITQAAPEGAAGPPPDGYEVTAHYTGTFLLVNPLFWIRQNSPTTIYLPHQWNSF